MINNNWLIFGGLAVTAIAAIVIGNSSSSSRSSYSPSPYSSSPSPYGLSSPYGSSSSYDSSPSYQGYGGKRTTYKRVRKMAKNTKRVK